MRDNKSRRKRPCRSFFGKIPVRAADKLKVAVYRRIRSEGVEFFLFDGLEEDHLYLERDLRDFVKEEDAFMRRLEQPLTHRRRAGKGAAHMAEQVGKHAFALQCRAVHFNEGTRD